MDKAKGKQGRSEEKFSQLSEKIESMQRKLEAYDSSHYAVKSVEKMLNWFLAISVGLLIAIFSNLDKYKVENTVPAKPYLVIGMVLVMISTVAFAIIRFSYFIREASILKAKGELEKLRYKLENGDETITNDVEKLEKPINLWIKGANLTSKTIDPVKSAVGLLVFSVVYIAGYYVFIIIKYF